MKLGVLEKKILVTLYVFELQERETIEVKRNWWDKDGFEGFDLGQIARFLKFKSVPNSMYYALKRLESKNLVERFSGYYEWDRRMAVKLTEQGRKIAKKLLRQIATTISHFMHILREAKVSEAIAK